MRFAKGGSSSSALVLALLMALVPSSVRAQVSVAWPVKVGLTVPSYDRVDGLSLRFGPSISVGDDRLVAEPVLTYRSHLGKVDPSLSVVAGLIGDSALVLQLSGSRGTFSNDEWIRSDMMNSVFALGIGRDARNYFRADRGEARLVAHIPVPLNALSVFAGIRTERAWSTGWRPGERAGPFSVFGRHDDVNGIERPNPLVDPGHITSAIGGGRLGYESDRSKLTLNALIEVSGNTPLGGHFQQLTLTEEGGVNTVAAQRLELDAHLVTTNASVATPAQRLAYLGGSGTLATVDLLELGGDHLFFLDTRYVIPIRGVEIPFLGEPFIAPRFAAGAAGVSSFGRVTKNIGLRVGAGVIRLDVVVNPDTHQREESVGVSFSR